MNTFSKITVVSKPEKYYLRHFKSFNYESIKGNIVDSSNYDFVLSTIPTLRILLIMY